MKRWNGYEYVTTPAPVRPVVWVVRLPYGQSRADRMAYRATQRASVPRAVRRAARLAPALTDEQREQLKLATLERRRSR